jgi:hypothetical protein
LLAKARVMWRSFGEVRRTYINKSTNFIFEHVASLEAHLVEGVSCNSRNVVMRESA